MERRVKLYKLLAFLIPVINLAKINNLSTIIKWIIIAINDAKIKSFK